MVKKRYSNQCPKKNLEGKKNYVQSAWKLQKKGSTNKIYFSDSKEVHRAPENIYPLYPGNKVLTQNHGE